MKLDLQKATLTKRISAFLLDAILLLVLITGIAALVSSLLNVDAYSQQLEECYEKYEALYDVKIGLTQEEYEKLTPDQLENYKKANDPIAKDQEAIYAYNMVINMSMIVITAAILGGYLVLEFLVPLKLGNGKTLGKKIFAIAVMRIDGVKLNTVTLFVRTVLGKFTLETMIPLMIVLLILFGGLGLLGTAILGLILLLQVILMITSRTGALIHDKLANTVVVDMASQMIFGSDLELIAYKERMQAEKAARQDY